MLFELFNTKQKIRILQLFLNKPEDALTIRSAARILKLQQPTVARALRQFIKADVIIKKAKKEAVRGKDRKERAFSINKDFILYPEIRALFLKAQLLIEGDLVEKLKRLSGISLIIFTGALAGGEKGVNGEADMLIVGKVNRDQLKKIMRSFEKQMNLEITYAIMTKSEYEYRKDITDKFLYGILEGRKMVVLDRIGGMAL